MAAVSFFAKEKPLDGARGDKQKKFSVQQVPGFIPFDCTQIDKSKKL